MSERSLPFVKVYNKTDKPVGPISFGGKEYIFQPDQTLNPGTYYMVDQYPDLSPADELDSPEERQKMRNKLIRKGQIRTMEHDPTTPSKNWMNIPGELQQELKKMSPKDKAKLGVDRLTFIDDKIEGHEDMLERLAVRIAEQEAKLRKLNAEEQAFKDRSAAQREADTLEAEIAKHMAAQKK